MTENQQKRSIWAKMHIDLPFLLCILSILAYSAFVMWSASGQDVDMMERKIGQIFMGLCVMLVMAQIPPRVY
jgi:rod shape determining protein RodA